MCIQDPNFSVPDPGAERCGILGPDPQQNISIFVAVEHMNDPGSLSQIRIVFHPKLLSPSAI